MLVDCVGYESKADRGPASEVVDSYGDVPENGT